MNLIIFCNIYSIAFIIQIVHVLCCSMLYYIKELFIIIIGNLFYLNTNNYPFNININVSYLELILLVSK